MENPVKMTFLPLILVHKTLYKEHVLPHTTYI